MLSGLGATETGPSVTFTTPEMGRSGVIGLPAAGTLVKLAAVEEKLEIRVRSPSVTTGYWRQPELTAQAFDEEGFFRLGDAVRLIDPAQPSRGLKFDGRIGEDFKLASGTWVSVGPLRAELIGALAPIAQDVVIAGLDADFVAILVIPDVDACAAMLALPSHAHARGTRRRTQTTGGDPAAPHRARACKSGQQPRRTPGARAADCALTRSWRDHGQGFDQPARGIAASRGPRGRAVFSGASAACRHH